MASPMRRRATMAELDKIDVAADVHADASAEEKPLKEGAAKDSDGNDAKGESETEAGSEVKGDMCSPVYS